MITVSENALEKIGEYFKDKEVAPIRLYVAPGGCSGPVLSLALDEAGEGDVTEKVGDYEFVVQQELADDGAPFSIDARGIGFVIDSKLELAPPEGGGCAGCSGGC